MDGPSGQLVKVHKIFLAGKVQAHSHRLSIHLPEGFKSSSGTVCLNGLGLPEGPIGLQHDFASGARS